MERKRIRKEYLLAGVSFFLLVFINVLFFLNTDIFVSGRISRLALLLLSSNVLFIAFLILSFFVILRTMNAGMRAHELSRLMLDTVPMACSIRDRNNNVLDCNQELLRIFGYRRKSEFIYQFDRLNPEFQPGGRPSRELALEHINGVFETGYRHFRWIYRGLDGGEIPVDTIFVKVPWERGDRFASYSRDLREEIAGEKRIREADALSREMEIEARSAQAANEAKSRFLASMSHEIRTPMNAIIGMSDLMRTDNLDETQKSFFEDIKKMSRALLQIINDILDFSKIEAGQLEMLPVHFNFFELYDNVCSMIGFAVRAKGLEWKNSLAPDLPEVLFGDDVRIRQVLVNVLNNAVKYTREGYIDFSVGRTRADGKDFIVFTIRDTGIGIRKEDFGKIFDRFGRTDNRANRGIAGTGLGLSITRRLLDLMKGSIRLESEYGKGSEFTVLLPLVHGDPSLVEKDDISSFVAAREGVTPERHVRGRPQA
jgi:signal transduction histidine kinase